MNHSSPASVVGHTEPIPFPLSPAEHLYRLLDDRVVRGADGNWRTRVYGVMTAGDALWVQMMVVGPGVHSLLLRVDRSTEAADAIRGVEFWVGNPHAQHDRVIDVAKVASGVCRPS